MDRCPKCRGLGNLGWLELRRAADEGEPYLKSIECPICHGDGGWTTKPKYKMTLNDIRKQLSLLPTDGETGGQ